MRSGRNRPHPAPLPQGEGDPFGRDGMSHGSVNFGSLTKVLPLPGGEGRGEGGAPFQTASLRVRSSEDLRRPRLIGRIEFTLFILG